MFNPSKPEPVLNNPTQRANDVNDPQFQEQQGYFPYDLTHQEFLTTRFGEVTPTMNLHTVPGDRIVYNGNDKTVLTQISGNFMSTVNEYSDSFFVPTRSLFPINYEKLIPNPTKGDDLPMSALPKFPIGAFIVQYLQDSNFINFLSDGDVVSSLTMDDIMILSLYSGSSGAATVIANPMPFDFALTRWFALCTMLSRGQLLDTLGYGFPDDFQEKIDEFYRIVSSFVNGRIVLYSRRNDVDDFDRATIEAEEIRVVNSVSEFRDLIDYALEHSYFIRFSDAVQLSDNFDSLIGVIEYLYDFLTGYFPDYSLNDLNYSDALNSVDNSIVDIISYSPAYINLSTVLAYQQIIAQYYSNNTVDNIFNSDLYMQNLRSILFPPNLSNVSSEPVFSYNGVSTAYDSISFSATYYSLIALDALAGRYVRQYQFICVLFLLRNSLRYGDYFSTARPNMLAVGDLSINVENGAVSPIDVTKNLLMQRYLNAANYIGSGFLPYFASIFGVTPSDVGTYPRFITHHKQTLKSDITTNTASNQGAQTTNLLGYTEGNSWDCFIDDYGVILVLKSYDVLPIYTDGVDRTFSLSDRFDYFNPMLQNIGDQPILRSELTGYNTGGIFGYTMRNAELKFKVSRAHGGFVRGLKGFYLPFPLKYYFENGNLNHIDPDFIRDRPIYMDSIVPTLTGVSPAEYYHFVVACVNQLNCARKIQATPPVLF